MRVEKFPIQEPHDGKQVKCWIWLFQTAFDSILVSGVCLLFLCNCWNCRACLTGAASFEVWGCDYCHGKLFSRVIAGFALEVAFA